MSWRNDNIEKARNSEEKWRNNNRDKIKKRQKHTRAKWLKWFKSLNYNICSKCGYNKCFDAIEFHHRDPSKKSYGIASRFAWAFNEKNKELLLKEIAKCDILCANCHKELHSNGGE